MAVQIELTQKLIDALAFDQRIVGLDSNGKPVFQKTPVNVEEWVLRDGGTKGQAGLVLRVTPGAMTWSVRRKMAGKSVRRAMGRARNAEDYTGAVLTLAEARERATSWLRLMQQEVDPHSVLDQHRDETRQASDLRRLTLAVAFAEFIEAKRKHKAKLGEGERLEVGVGQRRKVNPKLRDGSTEIRVKVQRWLSGSPMWSVPIKDLTVADVEASLDPLLNRYHGHKVKIPWGPKSVSRGTMDKLYGETERAWWRTAKTLKLGVLREEGPLQVWRTSHESDWPEDKQVERALDTHDEAHVVWLKALMTMQEAAHDPAVFTNRAAPRSKGIKPHLSVLVDFYLLLLLWGTRQTETMLLEWTAIDFKKRQIELAGDTTKSGAGDIIPLTPWACSILLERQRLNALWRPDEPSRYVFPSREHGRPISSPRRVLVALAEETGVAITAHDLRRSLARELGSDEDLLHTARLLVSGAAMHHGAGRGGSRVSAVTERYLGDRAETLRPLYQQREDRLRQLVGLPVENPKSDGTTEAEAFIAKMKEDPAIKALLLEALLKS